ncbi:MAG: ureidoglycolate lyase [Alphaproteobacteria bacterium]
MNFSICPQDLTPSAFEEFGDVISAPGKRQVTINEGFAVRHDDLASVDVSQRDGRPLISLFHCHRRPESLRLSLMERHPLGSQAFIPLGPSPWLVVVSAHSDPCSPEHLHVFKVSGFQGVNYRRNVWHHPVLPLVTEMDFIVIDRGGPGVNLEERSFHDIVEIVL